MNKQPSDVLSHLDIGQISETFALHYLQMQQLQLVAKNLRSRYGEIDLIMLDRTCLCFIEVRARHARGYGSALDTVDQRKQKKIILTAQYFLQNNPRFENFECRFDVLALDYRRGADLSKKILDLLQQQTVNLQWIKHAYTL